MSVRLKELKLIDEKVKLIPLTTSHANDLVKAASVGALRDSVVFSITNNEWESVKQSLEYEINKYRKS